MQRKGSWPARIKNGSNVYHSCRKDVGFLKINFSLFLYLRPSPGRILHRWPRNRCSKWVAGEKRSENVTSTICNEFLVRIHSVVVFLGHQGCKWHRLSKRNNSNDDGIADVLKSTLQIWNLWFWQSIEIILCVHKLVQKHKQIKLIRVHLNWFTCKCTYPAGIFPTILTSYSVLKLKKYDNSVPATT